MEGDLPRICTGRISVTDARRRDHTGRFRSAAPQVLFQWSSDERPVPPDMAATLWGSRQSAFRGTDAGPGTDLLTQESSPQNGHAMSKRY